MHPKLCLSIALVIIFSAFHPVQDDSDPWKPEQLVKPEQLAAIIKGNADDMPLVIDIGPAGLIKGAVNIGPITKEENLSKLKQLLSTEKKEREIIVYCGCCPYKNCPNIRPAYALFNSLKFTRFKLLDLPHNLKIDWINAGFPMAG